MSKALTENRNAMMETAGWTDDQKELIKRTVAKDTTDDEFAMFMHYCQMSGLDPLRKQAHCVVRDYTDRRGGHKRDVTMMTGIDGFRSRAEKFPDYEGCQSGVVFQGDDFSIDYGAGAIHHVAKYPRKTRGPIGAWAIVRRTNRIPYIHWVDWNELFDQNSFAHKKMPEVMAKKTCEAQALRHEFPETFSGMYDPAEIPSSGERIMADGDNPSDPQLHGGPVEQPGIGGPTPDGEDTPILGPALDSSDDDSVDAPEPDVPEDGGENQPESDSAETTDDTGPTDKQIERFKELMSWAMDEASLVGDQVFAQAIDWINTKPPQNQVGAKLGVWKARRIRHDETQPVVEDFGKWLDEQDGLENADELHNELRELARQWIMTGEVAHDVHAFIRDTTNGIPNPDDLPL